MRHETTAGRPRARATAVGALVVAAALLAAFAWGLSEVVEEARLYAAVHGLPSDTSSDETTTIVLLGLAVGLLLVAAAVRRPGSPRSGRRRG